MDACGDFDQRHATTKASKEKIVREKFMDWFQFQPLGGMPHGRIGGGQKGNSGSLAAQPETQFQNGNPR